MCALRANASARSSGYVSSGMFSAVSRSPRTRSTPLRAIATMSSLWVRSRGAYERQKQPPPATASTPAIALTNAVAGLSMVSRLSMETVSRLPAIEVGKLLGSSPDIVGAVDRHGIIIFYNDGARSTLGYSQDEVLGQHVTRLYPDLAEARKVMTAMREGYGAQAPGKVR